MRKFISIAIVCHAFVSMGQNSIQSYEYWFNGNYAAKQLQTVVPAAQYTLNTAIPTNTLPAGLHVFHVRFKDDSARYSPTISQFFYKQTVAASGSTTMNAYQYWFDNQFANAVTQSVAATNTLQLNAALGATALPDGLHLLHIRFRDNANQWSSAVSQFFYKATVASSGTENKMQAYQYWFDGNYDQASTVSISPASEYQLSSALPTASLSEGLHVLHIRFKDQRNQWSSAISQFVYTAKSATGTANNALRHMQYWFDNDVSKAQIKPVSLMPVVQVTDMLDANSLPDGLHILHLRFADTVGQWSSTISQFFYKSAAVGFTTNVVSGYRYWFNDEGAGSMVFHSVPEQNPLVLNTTIDMGCLTLGANRLHIQFLDKSGLWSTPLTDTISVLSTQHIYRFTGNGNWSNAANWQNNARPALDVPGCKQIIIDHAVGGTCIVDVPQHLLKNAAITVLPGKTMVIPQTLQMK